MSAFRLPLVWQLAWRTMAGPRSTLLAGTARAALVATGLGVTAMVVAMALMTGYTEDLKQKLVGLQAEITALPLDPNEQDPARVDAARALPGVVSVGHVAYGDGLISSPAFQEGVNVFLRGVDAAEDPMIGDPAALDTDDGGLPKILVGSELLRRLDVTEGEAVRLVLMGLGDRRPSFHYKSVRIAGTFTTGFAEFDASWVVVDHSLLTSLPGVYGRDLIELHLEDDADVDSMIERIEETLGPGYLVESWQRLNRELFAALALQEKLLFLVLGLIVVVSTFNSASTLVVLVRERMRTVGVLGTLGLGPRQLWSVFALCGLLLGIFGTALGIAIGSSIAWVLTTFELIRFGPEVAAIYFIDAVPFRVEAADLVAIVAFSLTATLLACALPARRAATVTPADALRYE